MVALSVASKPLALPVTPDLPVSVPASSVITWSGGLTPHIVDDQQIYAMMPLCGRRPGPVIRLEGTGRVLVEQAHGVNPPPSERPSTPPGPSSRRTGRRS